MKSVGTYISGVGHVGLVVWMVVGWGTDAEPLPFEVTEVSMISTEEFSVMTQGAQPDQPVGAVQEPEQPVIEDPEPPTPAPVDETPPEVAPPPAPIETPAPEAPPAAPDVSVPETVVTDTPPDVPDTPTLVAPPPSAELGESPRPVPRPAPRVAPEIVVAPDPDTTVAPDVTQAAVENTEAPVEDEVEITEDSTAPEAATDQIVTEAEEPAFAPEISARPQTRPSRPAPAPVEDAETETEIASNTGADVSAEPEVDPVAAALAEAAASNPTPTPGLSGGQLSDGDKSGFLRQIGNCWNTGALSTGAQNTVIVMTFEMSLNGRPVTDTIRLGSFNGGTAADAEAAYQTARRALIRCTGEAGYDLPADQYEQWQQVELTVDPSRMRQR